MAAIALIFRRPSRRRATRVAGRRRAEDGDGRVNRGTLLRHLRRHGCYLKREGAAQSSWCNRATGAVEACRDTVNLQFGLQQNYAVRYPSRKSAADNI